MTILGGIFLWIGIGLVGTTICHALDYFFSGRYVERKPFLEAYHIAMIIGILTGPVMICISVPFVGYQCYKYMKARNWTSIRVMRANYDADIKADNERRLFGKAYQLVIGGDWEIHYCLGRKKSYERS